MMTIISLWLKDGKEDYEIKTMTNIPNPFKVGDIVRLSVSAEEPNKCSELGDPRMIIKLKKDHKDTVERFNFKHVEIYEERKFMDLEKNKITIEYTCRFISTKHNIIN